MAAQQPNSSFKFGFESRATLELCNGDSESSRKGPEAGEEANTPRPQLSLLGSSGLSQGWPAGERQWVI